MLLHAHILMVPYEDKLWENSGVFLVAEPTLRGLEEGP